MRSFPAVLMFGAALLGGGVCANAQYGGPWRDQPRYNGGYNRSGDAVGVTLRDLDRLRGFGWGGHEMKQADQARNDLLRFEDRWRSGRWDGNRLDNAIGHIQHLV